MISSEHFTELLLLARAGAMLSMILKLSANIVYLLVIALLVFAKIIKI